MKNIAHYLSFQFNCGILCICALFLFISCKEEKKNGFEIDCDYAKKQAVNDFNYKNYTWTDFEGLGFDLYGQKEFIALLSENNIKHKSILVSCISFGNEKYENCQEDEMNLLLKNNLVRSFLTL